MFDEAITVDGVLDEAIWETAESADNFHQYFPTDTIMAVDGTTVKMLYSDTHLFVGIKGNSAGDKFITRDLQRDFRGGGIDQITLLFDTFNDGNIAFFFSINPFGVRRRA